MNNKILATIENIIRNSFIIKLIIIFLAVVYNIDNIVITFIIFKFRKLFIIDDLYYIDYKIIRNIKTNRPIL